MAHDWGLQPVARLCAMWGTMQHQRQHPSRFPVMSRAIDFPRLGSQAPVSSPTKQRNAPPCAQHRTLSHVLYQLGPS